MGGGVSLFEEQEEIKRSNEMIGKMEEYLVENCPGIVFFQEENEFYADAHDVRGYGRQPEYLDDKTHKKYARAITDWFRSSMDGEKNEEWDCRAEYGNRGIKGKN